MNTKNIILMMLSGLLFLEFILAMGWASLEESLDAFEIVLSIYMLTSAVAVIGAIVMLYTYQGAHQAKLFTSTLLLASWIMQCTFLVLPLVAELYFPRKDLGNKA